MRKDKVIGAAIGVVVALVVVGVGYEIGHHAGAAHVSTIPGNAMASSASSQPASASTWKGLSQADPKLESALRGATVETADGKTVPFPTDKPVMVFAPWCEFCHKTFQLLQQEGLVNKFTLVAAGLGYQEGGGSSSAPQTSLTLVQAKQKVQQSFDSLGVRVSANDVLYAMPGTAVDKAIPGYPEILVPHGGHWYVQPGYVADPNFWHNLLDS